MIDEVTIGPFIFEYDQKSSQMFIAQGEEVAAMVEVVTEETWNEFCQAALKTND